MNILFKIKTFFKKSKKEKSFDLIFQEYLKIKDKLKISDINFDQQKINLKITYQGSLVPFWLDCQRDLSPKEIEIKIQEILSLVAMGLALNLNLVSISQFLKKNSEIELRD